jgi:hypothetical protein
MGSQRGFVYAIASESMPNLVKIGWTLRSPHVRAADLSVVTGVPLSFYVMALAEVAAPQAVERALHRALGEFRVDPRREFFAHRSQVWAARLISDLPVATSSRVFVPLAESAFSGEGPWTSNGMLRVQVPSCPPFPNPFCTAFEEWPSIAPGAGERLVDVFGAARQQGAA